MLMDGHGGDMFLGSNSLCPRGAMREDRSQGGGVYGRTEGWKM